jgi:guanylate kinase
MIYLIMGRTASGKDTLADILKDTYGMHAVKSRTTRPKRSEDDDSHIFVDQATADAELPDSVARTNINGYDYYATMDDVTSADIYVIDPDGAHGLARSMPDTSFQLVYITCPDADRKARFIARETTDNAEALFNARNDSESSQFDELEEDIKDRTPLESMGFPVNVRKLRVVTNDGDISCLTNIAQALHEDMLVHDKLARLVTLGIDNNLMDTDKERRIGIHNVHGKDDKVYVTADIVADIVGQHAEDTRRIFEWAMINTDLLDETPKIHCPNIKNKS